MNYYYYLLLLFCINFLCLFHWMRLPSSSITMFINFIFTKTKQKLTKTEIFSVSFSFLSICVNEYSLHQATKIVFHIIFYIKWFQKCEKLFELKCYLSSLNSYSSIHSLWFASLGLIEPKKKLKNTQNGIRFIGQNVTWKMRKYTNQHMTVYDFSYHSHFTLYCLHKLSFANNKYIHIYVEL